MLQLDSLGGLLYLLFLCKIFIPVRQASGIHGAALQPDPRADGAVRCGHGAVAGTPLLNKHLASIL